jgi:hypothetical protein
VTSFSQQQSEAERIRSDFFGQFPQFNRPELLPHVQLVTQQVMQEIGTTNWSEPVRNMVGARLLAAFPHLGQGAPSAPPVSAQPAQVQHPQAPAAQLPQTARATTPYQAMPSEQQEIQQMIFGGNGGF